MRTPLCIIKGERRSKYRGTVVEAFFLNINTAKILCEKSEIARAAELRDTHTLGRNVNDTPYTQVIKLMPYDTVRFTRQNLQRILTSDLATVQNN